MQVTREQMVDIFKRASTAAEVRHFAGGRGKDQVAWASPQRDLMNLMPALLNASCAFAQFALTEEEQEALGNFPVDLYNAAASQNSGAAYMIPQMTADAMENAPEAVSKFIACFGLSALMVQGLLPVFSVRQNGMPAEKMSPDVTLAGAFAMFDSPFRERVMKKLKKLPLDEVPGLFSEEVKKLVDELKELNKEDEDEQ